jgi:hypothetical protein
MRNRPSTRSKRDGVPSHPSCSPQTSVDVTDLLHTCSAQQLIVQRAGWVLILHAINRPLSLIYHQGSWNADLTVLLWSTGWNQTAHLDANKTAEQKPEHYYSVTQKSSKPPSPKLATTQRVTSWWHLLLGLFFVATFLSILFQNSLRRALGQHLNSKCGLNANILASRTFVIATVSRGMKHLPPSSAFWNCMDSRVPRQAQSYAGQ